MRPAQPAALTLRLPGLLQFAGTARAPHGPLQPRQCRQETRQQEELDGDVGLPKCPLEGRLHPQRDHPGKDPGRRPGGDIVPPSQDVAHRHEDEIADHQQEQQQADPAHLAGMQVIDVVHDTTIALQRNKACIAGLVDNVGIVVQADAEEVVLRHGVGGVVGLVTADLGAFRCGLETFDDGWRHPQHQRQGRQQHQAHDLEFPRPRPVIDRQQASPARNRTPSWPAPRAKKSPAQSACPYPAHPSRG